MCNYDRKGFDTFFWMLHINLNQRVEHGQRLASPYTGHQLKLNIIEI